MVGFRAALSFLVVLPFALGLQETNEVGGNFVRRMTFEEREVGKEEIRRQKPLVVDNER
jgi:hypothetical protein